MLNWVRVPAAPPEEVAWGGLGAVYATQGGSPGGGGTWPYVAGAAIGAAGSLFGAHQQQHFESVMSSTAYQRAMSDMGKAGLNPMLAFSQGGASTPSVSAVNPGAPVADALTAYTRMHRLEQPVADSTVRLNDAATTAKGVDAEVGRQTIENLKSQQSKTEQETKYLDAQERRERLRLSKEGVESGMWSWGQKALDMLGGVRDNWRKAFMPTFPSSGRSMHDAVKRFLESEGMPKEVSPQ